MKKLELNQMESLIGGAEKLKNADESGGCTGANVIGCMSDVYTNHGWGSVIATLSTAFIPETAVAFALACAAKNKC